MKKTVILLLLTIKTISANCDVIYFPYQYSLLCYSVEYIYSFEKAKKVKNTTSFWIGGGCVGSFLALSHPFMGVECAIEKRHYFKPDQFNKFFISVYLGTAYVSDLKDVSSIGIIPGLKINYKIQKNPKCNCFPHVDDFRLKYCILNENSKNKSTGRKRYKRQSHFWPCLIR